MVCFNIIAEIMLFVIISFCLFFMLMWPRGVVVITTEQLRSTEPELRFCAGSNQARGVSGLRKGEYLRQ